MKEKTEESVTEKVEGVKAADAGAEGPKSDTAGAQGAAGAEAAKKSGEAPEEDAEEDEILPWETREEKPADPEPKEKAASAAAGKSAEEASGSSASKHGRSRRRPAVSKTHLFCKKLLQAAAAVVVLAACACLGIYIWGTQKYAEAFFPNTRINGLDASGRTVEEVKAQIEEELSAYTLTLLELDGETEQITAGEIGLHSEFDGSLEILLAAQDPKEWPKYRQMITEHQIETMLVFDEELLDARLESLRAMDPENKKEPENAKISEYNSETKSYGIDPDRPGSEVIEENLKKAVVAAVTSLQAQVDLEAEDCYMRSAIREDNRTLQAVAAELNHYVGTVITYTFGDETEVLDGDRIHEWLSLDGTTVILDETQPAVYAKELAEKYNTSGKEKQFKTTYGETVTIAEGTYGWVIDEEKEAAEILAIVKAGEQQTREPVYSQTAASHGETDYGNTYVEINLTTQHLYFYKEGDLILETDFVSGNEARGMATPGGAYPLAGKRKNAVLTGPGYRTPVSYWMPFNRGIGLHDASWRWQFGGTIYKRSGSHGCINLPKTAAKTIYENISIGDPVLCYHLEVTETPVVETKAAETKPAATKAATVKPTAAPTAAPVETPAPTPAAEETAAPSESGTSAEETSPVGPGGETPTEAAPTQEVGPGATETLPASTEGSPTPSEGPTADHGGNGSAGQETPVGPSVSTEPQTEPVTAGGDKESFGPGFGTPIPDTQADGPEIGPGA